MPRLAHLPLFIFFFYCEWRLLAAFCQFGDKNLMFFIAGFKLGRRDFCLRWSSTILSRLSFLLSKCFCFASEQVLMFQSWIYQFLFLHLLNMCALAGMQAHGYVEARGLYKVLSSVTLQPVFWDSIFQDWEYNQGVECLSSSTDEARDSISSIANNKWSFPLWNYKEIHKLFLVLHNRPKLIFPKCLQPSQSYLLSLNHGCHNSVECHHWEYIFIWNCICF